jgi:prepilin-type N-terminal cleavage/methylation domain-containing protein
MKARIIKNKQIQTTSQMKPGFTLIEVITVLLVISIGMVGVLSLIVQNISSQSINKNTLIAYNLAQEGVELIRQVRDTNWMMSRPWRTSLASGVYYMDYTYAVPVVAATQSAGSLSQDSSGMYYSTPNSAAKAGAFTRIITLADHGDGLLVTANIYWLDHSKNNLYSLETELYDWR